MKRLFSLILAFALIYSPVYSGSLEIDFMEYSTPELAQAAYVTNALMIYGADVTSGQTYNASSYTGVYVPAWAFDEDSNSQDSDAGQWATSSTTDQWISCQFSSGKKVNKIRIMNGSEGGYTNGGVQNAKLEGSNNGSTWTKVSATDTDGVYASLRATDEFTLAQDNTHWQTIYFNTNNTSYTYYRIYCFNNYGRAYLGIFEIEMMEGISPALQSYSESTIKTKGDHSLKIEAAATDSLNKTLTKTFTVNSNLTGVNKLRIDNYALRTGSNYKIGLHDTGGTTTEFTPNIATSNTWQTDYIDLSAVSDANKDNIDTCTITITNADSANTIYLDYFGIFCGGGGGSYTWAN